MIKNKIKLSLAAAMVTATCGFAGTVSAPNSVNIDISGGVELKAVSEKTGNETIQKRTAEVTLALESELKGGTKIFTEFTAYDANQGDANADAGVTTTVAYAEIPIMDGKGKVIAGLAPNDTYGTDAFDNGGEAWQLAVNMPVAKGVKVSLVSKVCNEEEQNKNQGDSGATALRVDAKVGELMIGAKYAQGYKNKGNGLTGNATTELKSKVLMAYVAGEIAGLDVGFEYANKDITKVGAPSQADKQSGIFLSVGKTIGDLTAGIAYINLSKGMKGGDDFAPGMILDGNVDSSSTDNTSAIVIPLEYAVNDNLTANATFISADVQGSDATEFDLGAAYAMNDNIEIGAAFGKYSIDGGDDQTNVEIAVAISF